MVMLLSQHPHDFLGTKPEFFQSNQGKSMKISFNHIRADLRQAIERVTAHHLAKLEKLLKRYAPDLVQLHGGLQERPRKADFSFSLNLALPTGTLHATGIAADAPSSVRIAFVELEEQLKKHKEKLRKDYEWKRKRPRASPGTDRT
jgi:ribosome-associated translation inhibitor RaiA